MRAVAHLQDAVGGWPLPGIHGQQLLYAVLGFSRYARPGSRFEVHLPLHQCSCTVSSVAACTLRSFPGISSGLAVMSGEVCSA